MPAIHFAALFFENKMEKAQPVAAPFTKYIINRRVNMKEYKYVELECVNHRATDSTVTAHREIIDTHAKSGYRYIGYIPTKMGPSGKILTMDLIFEKEN